MTQEAKKHAASHAVTYVEDDMIIGLGTGSTANYAIDLIAERVRQGLRIQAVPTSRGSQERAAEAGIPLLEAFEQIDVTIDGADEVDPSGNLIKGGGGALTREKIVAAASHKEIIIVDRSKLVDRLGQFPLPVEVLPFGYRFVQQALADLGCTVKLRMTGDTVYTTDNANFILDCSFAGGIADPRDLSTRISAMPGVVENGLFCGLTDVVIVGSDTGETEEIRFSTEEK